MVKWTSKDYIADLSNLETVSLFVHNYLADSGFTAVLKDGIFWTCGIKYSGDDWFCIQMMLVGVNSIYPTYTFVAVTKDVDVAKWGPKGYDDYLKRVWMALKGVGKIYPTNSLVAAVLKNRVAVMWFHRDYSDDFSWIQTPLLTDGKIYIAPRVFATAFTDWHLVKRGNKDSGGHSSCGHMALWVVDMIYPKCYAFAPVG